MTEVEKKEINTTLAGVEGLCTDPEHVHSRGGVCLKCGVMRTIPDYTTDLNACMRVAREMNTNLAFDFDFDRIEVIYGYGVDTKNRTQEMTDLDNPALTLSTMLAEIARERQ